MHKELRSHVAGRRVKRESGVNPEQFLLLCIPTLSQEFWFVAIFATGASWEGATNGDESEDLPVHLERLVPAGYG
jgi:hypothetical protein